MLDRRTSPRLVYVLIIIIVLILDHATKWAAAAWLSQRQAVTALDGVILLFYAKNPGAFLSLGASLGPEYRFWLFTIGMLITDWSWTSSMWGSARSGPASSTWLILSSRSALLAWRAESYFCGKQKPVAITTRAAAGRVSLPKSNEHRPHCNESVAAGFDPYRHCAAGARCRRGRRHHAVSESPRRPRASATAVTLWRD